MRHSKMCSFTLGHRIIPFLSILVVQIGTMKCFYCPQKDTFVVPWDSLSPDDQIFLRDKYPNAGQGAFCDLCVRSACPNAFFSRHSSSTSLLAPKSVDSGLQVPSGPLVVSGAAMSLPTESVCPCTVPYPMPMHCAHAWNLGLPSLQRLLQSLLLLPQGLPQGPIRLTTAGQLWLQIRATGSAAHPPSTQSDGNGKHVYIHLLPASFVCAVKPIFLSRTSDKKCKKNGSWN